MEKENKSDTFRKSSVKEWTSRGTNEDINSGSLQRIADALEANKISERMTENLLSQLVRSIDNMQSRHDQTVKLLTGRINHLKQRVSRLETKKNRSD